MSIRNLDQMFKPTSVALIGASARLDSVGGVVLRNLMRAGFAGSLMLVNPRHTTLVGLPVYPDVPGLPAAPDLAVIATPPDTVPDLIAALGARGTRAAVVITAGFGELGERGHALQQATLDAARPYLLRIAGPNCVGIMVPASRLDASFSHIAPAAGDLAFVSQSGAMITAVLDWAAPRGIGFSHVVSLGDMADVDFGDMLDYLAGDGATRAILLYIEGIRESRKFMSAARAAARLKPVLVVKVGRFAESARAATSHTGSLAGSDAVYDAAFRRAGLLRVGDMTELFGAVETLALMAPQQGERLAILTNGGGPGVLATDALIELGGRLAEVSPETVARLDSVLPRTWSRANPVDIIGDADGKRYEAALSAVLEDRSTDAVLVLNCPTALAESASCAAAVVDVVAKARGAGRLQGRNVLTAWLGEATAAAARVRFAAARIPSYETPDSAIGGFMHAVKYRRNQQLLMETPAAQPDTFRPDVDAVEAIIGRSLAAGKAWLPAEDVCALGRAYGIPFAETRVAADPNAAAAAAAALGGSAALKIRSPDITHKSDCGGVVLNLGSAERVKAEAAAMLERVRGHHPEARLDGFLVQQMIHRPAAIELILGINDDPVFGPVILFGQGGTAVEQLRDTTLEFPPLNEALARAQMSRTRVWRLLQGYRDRPPADIAAVTRVLARLSELAANHPEIVELDINPLLADATGVIAVDGRIRIAAAQKPGAGRLAIRPYPRELEATAALPSGVPIRIRPIRPEDETLLTEMAAQMTAEDLRMRFFTAVRGLSHQLAARLSQIDYARELALIAQPKDNDEILGVARFSADPDNREAEFAVAVRSDWKGRGIGWVLMEKLVDAARQRSIGTLSGTVLVENTNMLEFCRNLGFAITANTDDPATVFAVLTLKPFDPRNGQEPRA
jgi:acetyltransferase